MNNTKKNRQSQLYLDRRPKILTISNNETHHEGSEESKHKGISRQKESDEIPNIGSRSSNGKVLHTDKPRIESTFTINTSNDLRNSEYNSGHKLIQKLKIMKVLKKNKNEQSESSLPPIPYINEFVKRDDV
jgi:hypothetical protein